MTQYSFSSLAVVIQRPAGSFFVKESIVRTNKGQEIPSGLQEYFGLETGFSQILQMHPPAPGDGDLPHRRAARRAQDALHFAGRRGLLFNFAGVATESSVTHVALRSPMPSRGL